MKVALYLQSVAVVDKQATFIDTSTRISSIEIAVCLLSVTVVDRQATLTSTSTTSILHLCYLSMLLISVEVANHM